MLLWAMGNILRFKGLQRLVGTFQIEWEIVHQSVLAVTFTISDDLTDKIVIIYP